MSETKNFSHGWICRAKSLSRLDPPYRAQNIAICLASAYRQGYRDREGNDVTAILLRTIAAEAERTGSWHVPPDLQERIVAWVAERDGGAR